MQKTSTRSWVGSAGLDRRARRSRSRSAARRSTARTSSPIRRRRARCEALIAQFANPIVLTLLAAAVVATVNGASTARATAFLVARYGDAIAIAAHRRPQRVPRLLPGAPRRGRARRAAEDADAERARASRRQGRRSSRPSSSCPATSSSSRRATRSPADARLLQTINLATHEAALTGESLPDHEGRARRARRTTRPSATASTMLFTGTTVMRGKGRARRRRDRQATPSSASSATLMSSRASRARRRSKSSSITSASAILWACLAISAFMFALGHDPRRQARGTSCSSRP